MRSLLYFSAILVVAALSSFAGTPKALQLPAPAGLEPPIFTSATITFLPDTAPRKSFRTFHANVSAYNSVPSQTDDTPCIPAAGADLCVALSRGEIRLPDPTGKSTSTVPMACASNDLPLRSRIWIGGLGECLILDRMNARYTGLGVVDIYFGNDAFQAKSFGRRSLDISILP